MQKAVLLGRRRAARGCVPPPQPPQGAPGPSPPPAPSRCLQALDRWSLGLSLPTPCRRPLEPGIAPSTGDQRCEDHVDLRAQVQAFLVCFRKRSFFFLVRLTIASKRPASLCLHAPQSFHSSWETPYYSVHSGQGLAVLGRCRLCFLSAAVRFMDHPLQRPCSFPNT